jgi:hypothetical protein
MRKIFTKKFGALLISSCIIGTSIVLACAGGDWEGYENSNFTPEAFVEKKLSPFFYSDLFYYGIGHDEQQSTRFIESNIADWLAYLNNNAPVNEYAFLLDKASRSCVDSIINFTEGKIAMLPAFVTTYQFFKPKADKKTKAFLGYLSLAKEAEQFANVSIDRWSDDETKKTEYKNAAIFNKALLAGYTNAEDKFLKQRYWFQLIRSYFFNGEPQKAIDFFESNKKLFETNKLFYRSLAYTAGAYYKLKNFGKANYYYSLVFDGCDDLKTTAHYSFHPQDEKDWQTTLSFCKTREEKITLWEMLGVFYKDEKRSINEIYKLDPSSSKLNLLLARAVNKQERQLDADYASDDARAKTVDKPLVSLISNIANNPNTNDPFMWNVAAGYLYMLDHNYVMAENNYKKAEKISSNEKIKQWQLRLLKILNKVSAATLVDDKLEKEILNDVEWLRTCKKDVPESFRYNYAFETIKQELAKKYGEQMRLVKSECYVSKPAFYSRDKNVADMEAFSLKKNKTPYEELCKNLYKNTLEDLYEFQAIKMAFADKIDEAISLMEKSGEKAKKNLVGNPFNGRINDCHDCDHAQYKGVPYTKLSLLQKMKEMNANIAAGKDVYNNALLLGNAFYNMAHYGNARYFYESAVLGEYHYSPDIIDSVFRSFLIDMKKSTSYYLKALSAATNREQKAKCYYLLAKCERNEWYNVTLFAKNDYYFGDAMIDLRAIDNFDSLRQYSDTRYYQEALKECGYFRDYLKQ